MTRSRALLCALLVLACLAATPLAGQYFGKNKVRYKELPFQELKTQHFTIYFYPDEAALARQVGRMAERWDVRLSSLLHHQLSSRQPIVLYASHTDFEQTNVVPGMISETVGGVTLSLGRKVVIPAGASLAETNHVLGHELVHAFQYDMGPRESAEGGVGALPLWFVEGMAEYLSLGPDDPQTAMWMREAALRDQLPAIKDLSNSAKYFPYRYGEAFWAYVGARYGDARIGPLFLSASRVGPNAAIRQVLGIKPEELSTQWRQATLAADRPVIDATTPVETGRGAALAGAQPAPSTAAAQPAGAALASVSGAGRVLVPSAQPNARINVSPALSPDGNSVIFFSERSLFSINLYLANARTGAIERKITETAIDPHLNNLQFSKSAGAWSPDGRRFAFGSVRGAQARISIYDIQARRVAQTLPVAGAGEIYSPTWSPDGRQIAFSAIQDGYSNLYVVQVATGAVRRLTDDSYAELQPAWSPDGRRIAFTTDRYTADLNDLSFGSYRLALMDVGSDAIQPVPAAGGGNQINPQWSPDGSSLYFVSDANGIPNLYRVNLATHAFAALTNLRSGISGITPLSPAISVAARSGDVVFSAFTGGGYELVRWTPGANRTAAAAAVARLRPSLLAPRQDDTGAVATALKSPRIGLASGAGFTVGPYHPSLALDYIAPPSIAVGFSPYGNLVGGGTALHFSDLLGYHSLTLAFESMTSNGTSSFFRNLSGQAVYLNHYHRWTWGFGGGQVPSVSGGFSAAAGVVNGRPVVQNQFLTLWQMDRQAVGIFAYPFSRAQRLEFSAGFQNIGFAAEHQVQVFDLATGALLADQTQNIPAAPALNFGVASAALVYDTSLFGGVSPVLGQSYRLQAGFAGGTFNYASALADYRRYLDIARPLSLAGRVLHYGRYGAGADDTRLQPLFLGYPSVVRGYDYGSFSANECGPELNTTGACPVFDRLLGSKIAAVNAEVRLELLGSLGLWRTPRVPPVELAPFFDAGAAWTANDKADFLGGSRKAVSSEGVTLRANLLGFAVGSVSLAYPNDRPGRDHVWEFTLEPGF